jgi:hypothetical protein
VIVDELEAKIDGQLNSVIKSVELQVPHHPQHRVNITNLTPSQSPSQSPLNSTSPRPSSPTAAGKAFSVIFIGSETFNGSHLGSIKDREKLFSGGNFMITQSLSNINKTNYEILSRAFIIPAARKSL